MSNAVAASGSEFAVSVHTSPGPTCGTFSLLRLSLIGSEGETPPISVNEGDQHLLPGSSCLVRVRADVPLGRLVLVRLRLEPRTGFPDLDWHCSRVEVRRLPGGPGPQETLEGTPEEIPEGTPEETPQGTPEGTPEETPEETAEVQVFPGERWLQSADGDVELRDGKLSLPQDECEEKLKQQRLKQLQLQQKLIRWRPFVPGAPDCVDLTSLSELGPNLSYRHQSSAATTHHLRGFTGRAEAWTGFAELDTVFAHIGHQNRVARFVRAHWKEDWYFGYQCLNGCNPLLLQRTRLLPPNMAVTADELRPFLPAGSSLEEELERGTVYVLDYELLDGVPANVINEKPSYLSAPLCLLHLNPQGQLVPIAIQLQQTPGPENPVFLPSDSACDWLLAKVWVHGADFHCHQLASHYLRSHMLGELCCVAMLRHLPEPHPLHQLLRPHVWTSLQINHQARVTLLAPNGPFDKASGSGLEAIPVLLSRAAERIRYESLCVPDDLKQRGVENLPQNYYAQDALRVWDALHRFVLSWVDLYYSGDDAVQQDSELQAWISDINTHGLSPTAGFPASLQTKSEVSKFVTMIIFSCSALHAAVNFSQLDFALWVPNRPPSMRRPPPRVKGSLSEDDVVSFLPDVNSSCRILTALTLLSQPAVDFVPLCHYREAVFRGHAHRQLLDVVQAELKAISDDIKERNRHLELPYTYLCPRSIDNSVAI